MENYETLTATGKGTWGKPYQVKLVTFSRIYHSYSNDASREIIEYCICFKRPRAGGGDIRIFTSEKERTVFLESHFKNLQLTPVDNPEPVLTRYPLDDLIDKQLSSITFSIGQIQFDFNGPCFNFHNWPLIYNGRKVYDRRDFKYHKELCNLIGKTVTLVDEYLDLGLVIEFEGNCLIDVPLKADEHLFEPELVEYLGENNAWIIWQAGDPPFE